ncbi:hypothetical protein REPUB_Repub03eG0122900 [Reevesia pubescens]
MSGESLWDPPPHLSPFVDDEAEGYVPDYAKTIKQLQAVVKSDVKPLPGMGNDDLDNSQNMLVEGYINRTEAIEAAEKKRKIMLLEKQYHDDLKMELHGVSSINKQRFAEDMESKEESLPDVQESSIDTEDSSRLMIIPQSKHIDAVRWLPPVPAFDRFAAIAYFDTDSNSPAIEIHSLNPNIQTSSFPTLTLQSSWTPPSRISSLKTAQSSPQSLLVAATFSGSLHMLASDLINGAMIQSKARVFEMGFHAGPVAALDLREGGSDCASVGEDGRVNLVSVIGDSSKLNYRRIFDSNGLVGYTAVKWASQTEFVTGGYGFGLQWWDQRRPGGPVSKFKGNWQEALQALYLLGTLEHNNSLLFFLSDRYTSSSNISNISSTRILPVMICSEDGILAVIEQGEESIELLAEPCAINSFDIDQQNPSDVICSLEWESIVIGTGS